MDPENDIYADNAQSTEVGNTDTGVGTSTSQDAVNDNPAWNDALSSIPEEFHPHLKGEFSKWDKHTQTVQQNYAPFKEFVELGVGRDDIDQSLQLAHLFQTNPRGVFDFLNTQYNYIPTTQQAPQQGQNNSQGQTQSEFDISGLENTEFDISKDPRFQQVAQKAQLAEQMAIQMQNQQMEQQVNAQLNSEIAQLQTNYPHIPHQEIIKRAIANSQTSGGGREDLDRAAKEIDSMGWFAKKGTPAPPNLSGGGNRALPSSQVNPATMSKADRTAHVAELLRAANEG